MATVDLIVQGDAGFVSTWLNRRLADPARLGKLDDLWGGSLELVPNYWVPSSLGAPYAVNAYWPDFGVAGIFHHCIDDVIVDEVKYEGCKVGHLLCGSVLGLSDESSEVIFGVFSVKEALEAEEGAAYKYRGENPDFRRWFLHSHRRKYVAIFNRQMHERLRDLLDEIWYRWPIIQIDEYSDEYGVLPSSIRPYDDKFLGKKLNEGRHLTESHLNEPPDEEPLPLEPRPAQQDSSHDDSAPAAQVKSGTGRTYDPSKLVPPKEPEYGSSLDELFAWYHNRKGLGMKATLRDVVDKTEYSYAYIVERHGEYMTRMNITRGRRRAQKRG
jgi:hypothetical protein